MNSSSTADLLAEFIGSLGVSKVSIVAHSMGGLVASKYIADGHADKIDKLITIATPYLGAPKTLYSLETGNFFQSYQDIVLSKYLKPLLPNMKSVYQLLPPAPYFTANDTYYVTKYIDKPWWFTGDNIVNLTDYHQTKDFLLNRSWINEGHLGSAENFHNSLNLYDTLYSVNSYFIIGDDQPTIGKVHVQFVRKLR